MENQHQPNSPANCNQNTANQNTANARSIFSIAVGIFLILAIAVKFVPKQTNTDLPESLSLSQIFDLVKSQDRFHNSSSPEPLTSKSAIPKTAAIVQPISASSVAESETLSRELRTESVAESGETLSRELRTESAAESVASSETLSRELRTESVAESGETLSRELPTESDGGTLSRELRTESVATSAAESGETLSRELRTISNGETLSRELQTESVAESEPALNSRLFYSLKTALNFTGKYWLWASTTVSKVKQENKPDAPDKRSAEPISEPASSTSEGTEAQVLELTSQDAIILSLQNNRDVKNAYLNRILDRQDLAVAEDKFNPDFAPRVELVYNRNQLGSTTTNRGDLNLGANLIVRIPTGASISAEWTGARLTQNTLGTNSGGDRNSLDQDISITFSQPLLSGFGVDVNRASIEIARLNEERNILDLKGTLINNITQTLRAYRNLLQAQESLTIQQISLESAQRQLEYIEALVDAGRIARIQLVQPQTNVANRELDILAAENRLDQARLDLIAVLDIDKSIQIVATEKPENDDLELIEFDQEEAKAIALENNLSYLQSLIQIKLAEIDLLIAENNKNWDLDLNASYQNSLNNTAENNNDFRASISLRRQFGDRSFEQQVERSQIQLEITQNNLQEQRENLEIDVVNQVRDVQFSLQQVEQAQRARELSEQQLENEREKLRLGVGDSRLIDVLDFEEDLVNAKNRELNARISYLNSLTSLYSTLGVTLERWDITVEAESNFEEGD